MNNNKNKKTLNNNAIALLLLLNLVATCISIFANNDIEKAMPVAYASSNNSIEASEVDEKRRNKDSELDEDNESIEETKKIDFEMKSVAHFTESIEGIPMYVAFKDKDGVYFTYMKTDNPSEWIGGYWYASNEVLSQGYYDVNLLEHNDELRAIYINDNVNGGIDYMQLRPCNDTEKGYVYNK